MSSMTDCFPKSNKLTFFLLSVPQCNYSSSAESFELAFNNCSITIVVASTSTRAALLRDCIVCSTCFYVSVACLFCSIFCVALLVIILVVLSYALIFAL